MNVLSECVGKFAKKKERMKIGRNCQEFTKSNIHARLHMAYLHTGIAKDLKAKNRRKRRL
jgi:hypothetical protein